MLNIKRQNEENYDVDESRFARIKEREKEENGKMAEQMKILRVSWWKMRYQFVT